MVRFHPPWQKETVNDRKSSLRHYIKGMFSLFTQKWSVCSSTWIISKTYWIMSYEFVLISFSMCRRLESSWCILGICVTCCLHLVNNFCWGNDYIDLNWHPESDIRSSEYLWFLTVTRFCVCLFVQIRISGRPFIAGWISIHLWW